MRFTKMQGIGNDYVYLNCFKESPDDPGALAKIVSDRHFGIGSDGLILILPGDDADVRMRMFNADGSEGRMCGNGIRCLAKYVYDHGLCRKKKHLRVATAEGVKIVDLLIGRNRKATGATVEMGSPILEPARIPVKLPQKRVVDLAIRTSTHAYAMTCVSMGNPHAVIFVPDVSVVPLELVGPELERHPLFPERVNVHFVQVLSDSELRMRTWERGSGITLACGTGASAVCVAGVLTGRTARRIKAHLPGGDLDLEWREQNGYVYMTGPAVEVFTGDWPE